MSQISSKKSADRIRSTDRNKSSDKLEKLHVAAENTKELYATFREVVDKYIEAKEFVIEWSSEHLRDVGPTINHFGVALEHVATNAHSATFRFIGTMMEQKDIQSPNFAYISNLFVITILFLIVSAFGQFVGSYLALYVLSYFFLDFGVVLLVTIVMPLAASFYFHAFNAKSLSEYRRRTVAALFVFEQAILIGYMNEAHYFDTPYATLTQFIASFVYPFALSKTTNRLQVFAAVAGLSALLSIMQGMWASTVSIGFITIAIVYGLLAICLIQYTLEYRQKIDFDDVQVTMHYTFMIASVKMIGMISCGVSASQYSAQH